MHSNQSPEGSNSPQPHRERGRLSPPGTRAEHVVGRQAPVLRGERAALWSWHILSEVIQRKLCK